MKIKCLKIVSKKLKNQLKWFLKVLQIKSALIKIIYLIRALNLFNIFQLQQ